MSQCNINKITSLISDIKDIVNESGVKNKIAKEIDLDINKSFYNIVKNNKLLKKDTGFTQLVKLYSNRIGSVKAIELTAKQSSSNNNEKEQSKVVVGEHKKQQDNKQTGSNKTEDKVSSNNKDTKQEPTKKFKSLEDNKDEIKNALIANDYKVDDNAIDAVYELANDVHNTSKKDLQSMGLSEKDTTPENIINSTVKHFYNEPDTTVDNNGPTNKHTINDIVNENIDDAKYEVPEKKSKHSDQIVKKQIEVNRIEKQIEQQKEKLGGVKVTTLGAFVKSGKNNDSTLNKDVIINQLSKMKKENKHNLSKDKLAEKINNIGSKAFKLIDDQIAKHALLKELYNKLNQAKKDRDETGFSNKYKELEAKRDSFDKLKEPDDYNRLNKLLKQAAKVERYERDNDFGSGTGQRPEITTMYYTIPEGLRENIDIKKNLDIFAVNHKVSIMNIADDMNEKKKESMKSTTDAEISDKEDKLTEALGLIGIMDIVLQQTANEINHSAVVPRDELTEKSVKERYALEGKEITDEEAKSIIEKELKNTKAAGKVSTEIRNSMHNGNGIKLDGNEINVNKEASAETYKVNPLAMVLGLSNTNQGSSGLISLNGTQMLENIAKISGLEEIGELLRSTREPEDKDIKSMFGDDLTDKNIEELKQAVNLGVYARAGIVNSLGRRMMHRLPFRLNNNVSKAVVKEVELQLGLYAYNRLVQQGLLSEQSNDELDGLLGDILDSDSKNKRMKIQSGSRYTSVARVNILNQDIGDADIGVSGKKVYIKGLKLTTFGHEITERTILTSDLKKMEPKDIFNSISGQMISTIGSALEGLGISSTEKAISDKPIDKVEPTVKHSNVPIGAHSEEYIGNQQKVKWEFNTFANELADIYNIKDEENGYKGVDRTRKLIGINTEFETKGLDHRLKKVKSNAQDTLDLNLIMSKVKEGLYKNGFYMKWFKTVSGRHHIGTSINPQLSKNVHRFMTTNKDMKDVLNINDETSVRKLLLAVGQAFDKDLDKDTDENVLEAVKNIVDIKDGKMIFNNKDEIGKEINELKKVGLKSYLLDDKNEPAIIGLSSKGEGTHGIQTIFELARISKELDKGDTKVPHEIVMESDGITNGMIINLMMVASPNALKLLDKGGVYSKPDLEFWKFVNNTLTGKSGSTKDSDINHGLLKSIANQLKNMEPDERAKILEEINSNKLAEGKNPEFTDFYETAATELNQGLEDSKNDFAQRVEILLKEMKDEEPYKKDKAVNLLKQDYLLLHSLGKFTRSMAKDPVMVYIYGAGKNSILKGMNKNSVISTLYQKLAKIDEQVNPADINKYININNNINKVKLTDSKSIEDFMKDMKEQVINQGDDLIKTLVIGSKMSNYNKDKNPLTINNFKFYVLNEIGSHMIVTRNPEDKKWSNLFIDPAMEKNILDVTKVTLGKKLEDTFRDKLGVIDDMREVDKILEVARFSIFKYKLKSKLVKLPIDNLGNTILSQDKWNEITEELTKDGFGHNMKAIDGSWQSLSKKDGAGEIRTINRVEVGKNSASKTNLITSGFTKTDEEIPNILAAPTISIHSIDGFAESITTMNTGELNMFDATVTNPTNNDSTSKRANEALGKAWNKWDKYIEQVVQLGKELKNLQPKNIVDGLTNNDLKILQQNIENLMGYVIETKNITNQKAIETRDGEPVHERLTELLKQHGKDRNALANQEFVIQNTYATDGDASSKVTIEPIDKKKMDEYSKSITKLKSVIKAINDKIANYEENTDKVFNKLNGSDKDIANKLVTGSNEKIESIFDDVKKRIEECS